ncbi:MAG: DUF2946 family protein [Pseudolabrys sp.]
MTWLAIYAVALHAILLGLAPIGANSATVDPFSVICLHDAGTNSPAGHQPSGLVPGHACEHCNLCSAVAPPPAPDLVVFGSLLPARLLQVLRPASAAPSVGVAFRPNLARGPPLFV